MASTTDALFSDRAAHGAVYVPARTVDGSRWLLRGAQRFTGTALVMAVAGLWLLPGTSLDQDLILVKLVLSLVFGIGGLALLRSGAAERTVQVELDLASAELRLVRPGARGQSETVECYGFSELGKAEVVGTMARLWDCSGCLIAEVPMSDPETRSALMRALSAHGKI